MSAVVGWYSARSATVRLRRPLNDSKYQKHSDVDGMFGYSWLVVGWCSGVGGRLRVYLKKTTGENPDVRLGGKWRPPNCTARHKVAIVIPFRDRETHLQVLLKHLHPILQRQQLDYGVYVVEQYGNGTFNKATLMNIAYVFALSEDDYRCFIFHDVDLLSEDDRNLYTCADQPKHLSVAVDTLKYRLPYEDIFGGVVALTTDQFRRVNGFSNLYWGWGAEDDDMSRRTVTCVHMCAIRVRMTGWKIVRPPVSIARFRMIPHKKRRASAAKDRVYDHIVSNFTADGLNSLEYELVSVYKNRLLTHIVAKLKLQEPRSIRYGRAIPHNQCASLGGPSHHREKNTQPTPIYVRTASASGCKGPQFVTNSAVSISRSSALLSDVSRYLYSRAALSSAHHELLERKVEGNQEKDGSAGHLLVPCAVCFNLFRGRLESPAYRNRAYGEVMEMKPSPKKLIKDQRRKANSQRLHTRTSPDGANADLS
ncbi:lactose synthase [Branchiostoma belcheri]|nr:lactose synthase [Branchiostoma belcheri]